MAEPSGIGGIVLCGGRSTRMGLPKATLPFGPELMLPRVLRILSEVVHPCVVVAAPDQELPPLPKATIIARDSREGRGPLQGIAAGLAALPPGAEAGYITSCDVPLLSPAFVRSLVARLGRHEIAVVVEGKFPHPLAAVYRATVLPRAERLLSEDRLRPVFLFDESDTLRVDADELRDVDPDLASLANLNHPQDYLAALKKAGYEPEAAILARFAAD